MHCAYVHEPCMGLQFRLCRVFDRSVDIDASGGGHLDLRSTPLFLHFLHWRLASFNLDVHRQVSGSELPHLRVCTS